MLLPSFPRRNFVLCPSSASASSAATSSPPSYGSDSIPPCTSCAFSRSAVGLDMASCLWTSRRRRRARPLGKKTGGSPAARRRPKGTAEDAAMARRRAAAAGRRGKDACRGRGSFPGSGRMWTQESTELLCREGCPGISSDGVGVSGRLGGSVCLVNFSRRALGQFKQKIKRPVICI